MKTCSKCNKLVATLSEMVVFWVATMANHAPGQSATGEFAPAKTEERAVSSALILRFPEQPSMRMVRFRDKVMGQAEKAWHGNTAYQGWQEIGEARDIHSYAVSLRDERESKIANLKLAGQVKGTVTPPDGKPIVGVRLAVFPSAGNSRWLRSQWVRPDTNGDFSIAWTLDPWQRQRGSPLLVARDVPSNLAAAEYLSDGTTSLNLQLKPGLTIAGRVEGATGNPLANAQVTVWLMNKASRTVSQVDDQAATPDGNGRFKVTALPVGADYTVFVRVEGHGQHQHVVQLEDETNHVELGTVVLKMADQIISGLVVDADDNPVSGAHVSRFGDDQPQGSTTTDSKGRFEFKVCEGQVLLTASGQTGRTSAKVEAGDTNIVLVLPRNEPSSRQRPEGSSLQGKPLPALTAFGLPADAAPAGKPVLLCLLDIEQRPSRRLIRLLADQHDEYRQKRITVLVIQAAVTSPDSVKEWKEAKPVPFAIGQVTEKSEKTKWATGVESLPWLILTDAQGRVAAEGFAVDELETKLQALSK